MLGVLVLKEEARVFKHVSLVWCHCQVTLLSFSVESECTFLDYIKGG